MSFHRFNAADEVAVEAFLDGRIAFPAIAELVEKTLDSMPGRQPATIDDILEIDRETRSVCRQLIAGVKRARTVAVPLRA